MPSEFAKELLNAAPWLNGTEAVSEELGPELLAEVASAFNLGRSKVNEFFERYNTLVQSFTNPHALLQSEAYVAIGQALAPYGRANAFGERDYWLVADSFSTSIPVVLIFEDFQLPAEALSKLQELVNEYNGVFSELRVNTEFGAELSTLRPR